MAQKTERIVVPKFKTEAEEAQWWYDNRDKVEEALITAMDNGTIRRGTAQRLTSEARVSGLEQKSRMKLVEKKAKKDIKTVKVSLVLHRRIKVLCASTGENMESFVERALHAEIAKQETQPKKAG